MDIPLGTGPGTHYRGEAPSNNRGRKLLEGGDPRYVAPRKPEFFLREAKIEAGKPEPSFGYKVSVRNNGWVKTGQNMPECPRMFLI